MCPFRTTKQKAPLTDEFFLKTTLTITNFSLCMPETSIILLILSGLCRDESVFTVRHRTEHLTRGLVSWFSVHKPDEQEPATTNQTEVSGHIRHSKDTWTFNHTLPRIYVPHGLLLVGPDNEGQCFFCH